MHRRTARRSHGEVRVAGLDEYVLPSKLFANIVQPTNPRLPLRAAVQH